MMMRIILAALVALCGASAQAGTIGVLTPYMLSPTQASGGGWVVSPGSNFAQPSLRSYTSSLVGGTARISAAEAMTIAGRAGPLAVSTATSVALSDAAVAVGRCILLANPVCAVATGAALTAYQVYRVFKPESVPGSVVPAGSFDFDPGKAPDATCARWNASGAGFTEAVCSPQEWIDKQVAVYNANGGVVVSCPTGTVTVLYTGRVGPIDGSGAGYVYVVKPATPCTAQADTASFYGFPTGATVQRCGASIDASDPAYNVPAGGAIGPDGKCPTARYNHVPYTAEQAAAKVAAYPPTMPSTVWQQATKDAVESGKQTIPGTISSTGPASQTGPSTTTTTTPSGGTTTTTTHTPTYTYNYAGDTITYNTSYTDVTTNGGNTTTTTYNDAPATPQDPKDPCTANPDRAGCSSLGTPPAAEAIPNVDATPTLTSVLFAAPAGCPAPLPFTIFGRSFGLTYQPMCDTLATVRLIFLATGAAAAAFLFFEGLKA